MNKRLTNVLYSLAILSLLAPFGAGCAVTVTPDEVSASYYAPLYYNGYVVYYADNGQPTYYVNGVRYYVPANAPRYHSYVVHYRTHRQSYHRWYTHRGRRYRHVRLHRRYRHPRGRHHKHHNRGNPHRH